MLSLCEKRKIVILFLVLIMLLCFPYGSRVAFLPSLKGDVVAGKSVSYEICEERISVDLKGLEARFNIFLSINNTGSEEIKLFNFSIDLTNVSELIITNLSMPIYNYWLEERRYNTVLHIETSIPPEGIANVSLNFTTNQGILNLEDYSQFLFNTKFEVYVERFSFEIWLPAGCFLYTKNVDPVYPEPTDNFTDGERLVFQWKYENLPPGTAEIFVIYYSNYDRQSSSVLILPFPLYSPFPTSHIGLALIVAFSTSMAMFIYFRRKRGERLKDADIILLLTDSEKEILKLLSTSKGGTMTQKEIQKATGYSKAKVSVTISLLEKKGLVEKEVKGRTKIVKLKKKIAL